MSYQTANITDFQMKSPRLARVVVSTTGNPSAEFIRAELSRKLEGLAVPVAASFKQIKPGVSVGFVRANTPVRMVNDDKELSAYKRMTANVLMDQTDHSLWEVKTGATGRYLSRQDSEDLQALVSAATQRRPDVPRIGQLTIAKASAQELVAFVDAEGDMDYGFATATNEERVRVVSFKRRAPIEVGYDTVVSINPVSVPKALHAQVVASMTPAEKSNANAYWQKLFYWAPDYLRQLQEDVNQGTVL